jgi:spore germination protein YaaH
MTDVSPPRHRPPARRPPARAPHRALPLALFALLALVAAFVATVAAVPPGAAAAGPDAGIRPRASHPVAISHEVYGYLPYWRLDAGTVGRLDFSTLSTIAFFAVPIKQDGTLDTRAAGFRAYVSPAAAAVTNAAHDSGVRVVPTFQLFDSGSLPTLRAFLGSRRAQDRFTGEALALMIRRRADGANLDVEPVPQALAPAFASFVDRFAQAVHRRIPGAQVVVALSAHASASAISSVGRAADRVFIMGYDFHGPGSAIPGPVAPLLSGPKTVADAVARYARYVPVGKLILGVPAYGYSWPIVRAATPSRVQANVARYGGVRGVSFGAALAFLAAHGSIVRNAGPDGSWFQYWNAGERTWREVHFEDDQSMRAKFQLAIGAGLAGVGMWTLDADARGLIASAVRSTFVTPVRKLALVPSVASVRVRSGSVVVNAALVLRNAGSIPERGTLAWRIVDPAGRTVGTGRRSVLVQPGGQIRLAVPTRIGTASARRAGTYRLVVRLDTPGRGWTAPTLRFRQPY